MDEKLLNDNTPDVEDVEEPVLEEPTGFEVMKETFGTGINQKVLLVTKGISLKNIVKSSS